MARNRLEVVKDVLEYCRHSPKRVSWIMQTVRLDTAKTPKIITPCVKNGLLEEVPMKGYLNKGYLTTNAGLRFIQKYHELDAMLQKRCS